MIWKSPALSFISLCLSCIISSSSTPLSVSACLLWTTSLYIFFYVSISLSSASLLSILFSLLNGFPDCLPPTTGSKYSFEYNDLMLT